MKYAKWGIAAVAIMFLAGVGVHQWVSYQQLRANIGKHAYASVGLALRVIGRKGAYIGQIVDARWNRLPEREDAIQGFQPRYLVARETVEGVTESRWYCTYLIEPRPTPPKSFKPSPFPPFRDQRPF